MTMTQREKKMALAFGLVIFVFVGRMFVNSWFLNPVQEQKKEIARLEDAVNTLEFRELGLIAAQANLNHAQELGLPADPLLAQRIYQKWLDDLANVFEFRNLVVKPSQRSSRSKVYSSVQVTLEARATHEQLSRFLYAFENAAVLHRISKLHLDCKEHRGNPLIEISLVAEALSMPGSPERDSVFPRFALRSSLEKDDKTLKPAATVPQGFPKAAPFVVRIGTELIEVKEIGAAGWKLERGVKGTTVSAHPANEQLELLRWREDSSRISEKEIARIVKNNFFVKPAEPVEYIPQLDPIGNKVATRGQTLSFRVTSSGFPPETPPRFIYLEGDDPEGLFFDGETGDVIWEPNDETELGEYELIFYLYVKGEKTERDSQQITIRVRDPNTSPRLDLKNTYTVLAGTPFQLQLNAEDDESPAGDLTYALQGELPAGAEFNSSTGLLKWTTSENELPREIQLTAVVTDRGDPPMSDQQQVTLSLIEDFTRDTYLTGIIKIDEVIQASLYNRAENVTSVLLEGKPFRAAGLTGKVLEISPEFVVCEMDEEVWRLELGQALFERKKTAGPVKREAVDAPQNPEAPLVAPRSVD